MAVCLADSCLKVRTNQVLSTVFSCRTKRSGMAIKLHLYPTSDRQEWSSAPSGIPTRGETILRPQDTGGFNAFNCFE
jgi:hypothetical protein